MMLRRILPLILFVPVFSFGQGVQSFNEGWEFVKEIDSVFVGQLIGKSIEVQWENISLPHTANIEPTQKVKQQWQGTCFYRKEFSIPETSRGKHIAIQFDAAMQVADVYLNGKPVFRHLGGYLPFYIDISDKVRFDAENVILVKLNNEDNSFVPPGKPLADLDFNYYSGIYRNVWLIVKEKLYISNAIAANKTAGGGILVQYENITPASAVLSVKIEIKNDFAANRDAQVRLTLADHSGKTVVQSSSEVKPIGVADHGTFTLTADIRNPHLWSPESPYLYRLTVELLQNGSVIDKESLKTGIRSVRIQRDGLYLNDNKVSIRGTNRHQDYPFIGNAVSDNAQYRDAYKIKMAGFNFVRTSHYPQSPAFMDACDELGIMVMDAIPGWQFVGNDQFKNNSYQDIRDMIRRDRNHTSIVLWEASLNESGTRKDYMQKAHGIVHEELPFEGVYSAGWINDVYDVFLPARQHGKAPDYWKKYDKERPLLIAEYGDWEYYAQNAGFNQKEYKDLKEEERSSRQLRGFGEKRLLQQALNYQEAHNDNLRGIGLGDANWLMFDYNRGYADDIESSGIMDIFRLPKFAFYFYQSQVHPVISANTTFNKPMVFVANYWQEGSSTSVRVFSNCEEVELILNGKSLAKQQPGDDEYSTHLTHPPFIFNVTSFQPGTLTAVGYIGKKKVSEHKILTAGEPVSIRLRADLSGKDLAAAQNDVVFVYAEITDSKGVIVPTATNTIDFSATGDGKIVGLKNVKTEAGIATVLVMAGAKASEIIISAESPGLKAGRMLLKSH
jgi:beta-galactosidase